MLDPLWSMAFSLMFAGLFVGSAWHKFSHRLEFSAVMASYELIPVKWCYGAGLIVAGLEALAAVLTLCQFDIGLWLILALLLGYAGAMGLNLLKGRVHIDCGCGGAPIHLSAWLLLRNGVLSMMVLLALLPSTYRPVAIWDWLHALIAALALLLLYVSVNQLLANRSYWRMQNGVNQ